MKASTVCLAFSVLFSAMVSANGVIPVIDLDFTRSADQTLKKLNINDACIIAAATPMTFTYCREGSLTLWKYQALDMEQQPIIHTGAQQSPMALGRISVVEVESAACLHEYQSDLKPVVTRRIVAEPDRSVSADRFAIRLQGHRPTPLPTVGVFGALLATIDRVRARAPCH